MASKCAAYGWLGVELFFIVSGFVICMSAWGRTTGEFAVSRVSRLFPAYWAAVVFTSTVLFVWPEVRGVKAFSDVVVNLSMLQGGMKVPHIDHAYWTLFVELKFYVLFAIVILRGVTYRNCVVFCAVWTLAGIVAPTAGNGLLSFFAIPSFSPYFIAGTAFYLMRRFGPNTVLWTIAGLQFLLAQSHVHRMITNLGRTAAFETPAWPAHAIIACGFLVMAGIALGAFDRIRWRWLTHAGAVTYPLYLIHMRAGLTLIHHLRHVVAPVPLVLGVTAVMTVLAWVIHRLVERLGRLLRTGLRRGLEDIRGGTPRRAVVSSIPAQPPAPEAERIPAAR
ncbi:acyltransferase [Streptomyces sp. BR123]|uniref:acyltransferase family protein n=1 Tax=Streptomyces sp. BR123 TaxID=2749828 RepID=UPI0015C46BAB|nr:acyltransferase [Streptomyces sp. BR123]NXY98361.1 acyltransferase [Streptomyces sp. BR123]